MPCFGARRFNAVLYHRFRRGMTRRRDHPAVLGDLVRTFCIAEVLVALGAAPVCAVALFLALCRLRVVMHQIMALDRKRTRDYRNRIVGVFGVVRRQNTRICTGLIHVAVFTAVRDLAQIVFTNEAAHRSRKCRVVFAYVFVCIRYCDGDRCRRDLNITVFDIERDVEVRVVVCELFRGKTHIGPTDIGSADRRADTGYICNSIITVIA